MHTVRLPKESTAADVCETLRQQLPEDARPARLRLLEVFYSKIYKVCATRLHASGALYALAGVPPPASRAGLWQAAALVCSAPCSCLSTSLSAAHRCSVVAMRSKSYAVACPQLTHKQARGLAGQEAPSDRRHRGARRSSRQRRR